MTRREKSNAPNEERFGSLRSEKRPERLENFTGGKKNEEIEIFFEVSTTGWCRRMDSFQLGRLSFRGFPIPGVQRVSNQIKSTQRHKETQLALLGLRLERGTGKSMKRSNFDER